MSEPSRRARLLRIGIRGGALAIAVAVAVVALRMRSSSERCAQGMVELGDRCCGGGQSLEGDRCVGPPQTCASGLVATQEGCAPPVDRIVAFEGGTLHVAPSDWEAQGVVAPRDVTVAPFDLDAFEVTEARWAPCLARGTCATIELRGEPGRSVSRVTFDEAEAYCVFRNGRLPTSDELAFASAGTGGRRYPWGDTGAVCRRVAWGLREGPCGRGGTGPEIAGSHPDGASPEGVFDLAGNVAEWARAPAGQDLEGRAEVRGGSWADSGASALRAWARRVVDRSARSAEIGFRCAYEPRTFRP